MIPEKRETNEISSKGWLSGENFQASAQKGGTQSSVGWEDGIKNLRRLRQLDFSGQSTRAEDAVRSKKVLETCRGSPSSIWLNPDQSTCFKKIWDRAGGGEGPETKHRLLEQREMIKGTYAQIQEAWETQIFKQKGPTELCQVIKYPGSPSGQEPAWR